MAIFHVTLVESAAPATGEWFETFGRVRVPQSSLKTNATDAVVVFQGSNDKVGAIDLVTHTLDSNNLPSDADNIDNDAAFRYIRAKVVSVTGGSVVATAALGN